MKSVSLKILAVAVLFGTVFKMRKRHFGSASKAPISRFRKRKLSFRLLTEATGDLGK